MARSFARTGALPPPKSLTEDEQLVLDEVQPGVGEDELAVLTNLTLSEVYFVLTRLEQLGLVVAEQAADDDGSVPWLEGEFPLATVGEAAQTYLPRDSALRAPAPLSRMGMPAVTSTQATTPVKVTTGPGRLMRPLERPTLSTFDLAKELAKLTEPLEAEEIELPTTDERITSIPPPVSLGGELVIDDEVEIVPEADRPTLPPPTHIDEGDLPPETMGALSSVQMRTAHALYVTEYAQLPLPERLHYAQEGANDTLLALSFDGNPQILRALLAHPYFAVEHARIAARSHGSKEGLEAIARNPVFGEDTEVRDALFANPNTSEAAIDALLSKRPLVDAYPWTTDARAPERTKAIVRNRFRELFRLRGGDERAETILATEGAALTLLGGIALDARTSQLLTMQTGLSLTLLANLARFPGAPPSLVTHLAGLPSARTNPAIRALLMAHPNLSEARKKSL
jgi:hypothetical protein